MLLEKLTYFAFLVGCIGLCNGVEEDREAFADEGTSLSLVCSVGDELDGPEVAGVVSWRRHGRPTHMTLNEDKSLSLVDVRREDAGIYTCSRQDDQVIVTIRLTVRSAPAALSNVTVVPCTILASLHWELGDDGGYPINYFTAQYRLKHTPSGEAPDPWHSVLPIEIEPDSTKIDVYHLQPNSSYVFQIWANNKLGRGAIVELEAITMFDVQEIELGKHLLEGADTFDTRVWVAAVAIVMGTLILLASATIYILYKESNFSMGMSEKELEGLELIPNIILNPGYDTPPQDSLAGDYDRYNYRDTDRYRSDSWGREQAESDENSNHAAPVRLNNNTVIRPIRI